jgi:protein phosphatase
VVLALVRAKHVYLSWLGDAMAYRVTDTQIEPLTRPHTIWNESLRQGITPTNTNWQKVCMHSLGNQELPDPLEVVSFIPQSGDQFVLTTDGITNHISADTILNACRTISDPTTCAEAIIEHAIMAGSQDNCTCVVIPFEDDDFR